MKKGFTLIELLAVIIILSIICIIAIPPIIKNINDKKSDISSAMEEILFSSSSLYISNDRKLYPDTSGNVYCVTVKSLTDTEYLSNPVIDPTTKKQIDPNTYIKISISDKQNYEVVKECTEVRKIENIYDAAKLLVYNNNTCKTDGTTYNYMGGCYLKGAQASNYVWFSGFLYRIMGINKDGSVRMITEENVTAIPYHNTSSNFIGSHVESWLNEYFISHLKGTDKIVDGKFCQGAPSSTANLQRTDCTGGIEITKKVGLISIDEMNMSDNGNSYLKNNQFFWTMSPYSATRALGAIGNSNALSYGVTFANGVRAVINVNSETVITKGDGTLSDNYILNEDKTIAVTGKLNEKASSGEYVKLANKVYRVVSKNVDGTTKLIYDGYYQETAGTNYTIVYGSNNTFTKDSGIGQKLNIGSNSVYEWLAPDATTKSKIKTDSKWYQNPFASGNKYTEANKENATPIEATVGLINIGEMLSGQSASITLKQTYWTLTPDTSAANAWSVVNNGYANYYVVTSAIGVRPVINVNSNVTISAGNGTLSSPYEI